MANIKEKTESELEAYAFWIRLGDDPQLVEDHKPERGLSGCLATPLIGFVNFAAKKGFGKESRRLRYPEHEKTARSLLNNDVVRARLCESFQAAMKQRILVEKDVVAIVVDTFYREEFRSEHTVAPDPVLFAIVSYEIMKIGVCEYCPSAQTHAG